MGKQPFLFGEGWIEVRDGNDTAGITKSGKIVWAKTPIPRAKEAAQ